jgi:hypothetical protein
MGLAIEHSSKALLSLFFIVFALGALVLPSFGSVLDHHFVERQYDHAHIYVGTAIPEHNHPFQQDHSHTGAQEAAGAIEESQPGGTSPDDILYLTSDDGMGQKSLVPFVHSTQVAGIFPDPDVFILTFAHNNNIPYQPSVPPPKKPPLA